MLIVESTLSACEITPFFTLLLDSCTGRLSTGIFFAVYARQRLPSQSEIGRVQGRSVSALRIAFLWNHCKRRRNVLSLRRHWNSDHPGSECVSSYANQP